LAKQERAERETSSFFVAGKDNESVPISPSNCESASPSDSDIASKRRERKMNEKSQFF
jgi:hypothetical protein